METISQSLAENLVTLLVWDDENGKILANILEPSFFEGDHRVLVERSINYWRTYQEAPKSHISDLVEDILKDQKNTKRAAYLGRTLVFMKELSQSINSKYAMDRIHRHIRTYEMKRAILSSAERINSQETSSQDNAIEEVEEIWNELLRSRSVSFDPGEGLDSVSSVLGYLAKKNIEFDLGVPTLTEKGIVPSRGTVTLFVAGPKIGKTWSSVHFGKRNLLKKHKVLHISLEMSQAEVLLRYYQSLFAIPKRYAEVDLTKFSYNENQEFSGVEFEKLKPAFGLDSPVVQDELDNKMQIFGGRLSNFKVKQFAPRSLSINGLVAYLDALEIHSKFIPDLLIIDSPYLLKESNKDYRISLGRNLEAVRAIAVDRNIAIIANHQLSRKGEIAEDWSQLMTADTILQFFRTDAEKKYNLGRLFVSHARGEQDGFGLILTQNYAIGQFHLSSTPLPDDYWRIIKSSDEEGEDEP
jgi:hypothetical protein